MEIRQITAAERPATMFPLQAYAFMPSPWSQVEAETYRRRMRFFDTAVNLVAEEGGETLAGVSALRMRQNVRGRVHDMAGVASVAAHPSARRRGLVRELVTRLLRQTRDEGCSVSSLYPFRPSFYAKFGFVGIPRRRTTVFAPEGLAELLRADLPGEVERLPMRDGFEAFDGLTRRLLVERHGFAVFDHVRAAEFREDHVWVAVARSGGEVVGALRYRIDRHGGDLVGEELLTTGSLGRALLLGFLARHVDQVARIVLTVGTDDVPELWGTDLSAVTEGKVDYPRDNAPMARVLDVPALAGTPVGRGAITVEIVGDDLIGGVWSLSADDGRLDVTKGGTPAATLTAAGFSGLVYGVLDPVEVFTRGLGDLTADAAGPLGDLFPKRMPYLYADF
ncbi:GNAT family N-acetyltransferase [Actinoplanes aureus]|uniref:GNAT family N-acetyltransferase n=1 Tax=Actinoplanes aureus TaxID=2792083 RepID=A0A931C3X0_9ACTN|nr:GNAT family N-acetyltransferase [Actinoplanes aureus]MBG0560107.1 GNAT family N-acetyltransferase [Actinoplanes aureus]